MLLEPWLPSAAAAVKKRVADESSAARAKLSSQCGERAQTRERFLARTSACSEALEDEIASWATDALVSTASKPARRSAGSSLLVLRLEDGGFSLGPRGGGILLGRARPPRTRRCPPRSAGSSLNLAWSVRWLSARVACSCLGARGPALAGTARRERSASAARLVEREPLSCAALELPGRQSPSPPCPCAPGPPPWTPSPARGTAEPPSPGAPPGECAAAKRLLEAALRAGLEPLDERLRVFRFDGVGLRLRLGATRAPPRA